MVYAGLLGCLFAGFGYAVTHRMPIDVDVLRDRNTLYRELDDGRMENVFTLRLINKDQSPHTVLVTALNLPGAEVDSDQPLQTVPAEDVKSVVVRVRVPVGEGHGGQDFAFKVQSTDDNRIAVTTRARFFSKP
jgi:polyferredoxin